MGGTMGDRRTEVAPDNRTVFVVHGRDSTFRRGIVAFLRALDLRPLQWSQAVALTGEPSPYVSDVLTAAMRVAHVVLVLLTPDNEGRLRPGLWEGSDRETEGGLRLQARQNVIFEAGMAFAMARERTVLVVAGGSLDIASDLAGVTYVSFSGDAVSRNDLIDRLEMAGARPRRDGSDWLSAGEFLAYDVRPSDVAQISSATPLAEPDRTAQEVGRIALLVKLKAHCGQLRPILLQGVIDASKWATANAEIRIRAEQGDVIVALGEERYSQVMEAITYEESSVRVQSEHYDQITARIQSRGARGISRQEVRDFQDFTIENVAVWGLRC